MFEVLWSLLHVLQGGHKPGRILFLLFSLLFQTACISLKSSPLCLLLPPYFICRMWFRRNEQGRVGSLPPNTSQRENLLQRKELSCLTQPIKCMLSFTMLACPYGGTGNLCR